MNRVSKLLEILKRATPLIDIYDIPGDIKSYHDNLPSIGHGISAYREQVDYLKELFEKKEKNIVLICFEDLPNEDLRDYLRNSEYFRNFLIKKNYPKDSIILVVGETYFDSEDEIGPEWMVHDIIGHKILNIINRKDLRKYQGILNRRLEWYIRENMLPDKFFISGDTADILPDILSAIYMGDLKESDIIDAFYHVKKESKDSYNLDYDNSYAKIMVDSCIEFDLNIMQKSFIVGGYTISVL